MKSCITTLVLLLAAFAVSAQTVGNTYQPHIQLSKFDTLRVEVFDPVEFDGHYYNVSDDNNGWHYVFTADRTWVEDINGIQYTIKQVMHRKECPILHVEITDPYQLLRFEQSYCKE